MLHLDKVIFKNIGQFTANEQTLDFTGRSHLIQIDGKNNNTGGSSGAGKSTIAEIIDYAFDVGSKSKAEIQSWHTKEKHYAHYYLHDVDHSYIIKKTGADLTLQIDNNDPIKGDSKDIKEQINKIIKIPPKLFEFLLHKRQGQGGFFLNLKPKAMFEFMMGILGLEEYYEKGKKLEDKAKKTNARILEVQHTVTKYEEIIQEISGSFSITKPIPVKTTLDIKNVESQIQQLKDKELEIDKNIVTEIDQLEKPKKIEVTLDVELTNACNKIKEQLKELKIGFNSNKEELLDKSNSLNQAYRSMQSDIIKLEAKSVVKDRLEKDRKELENLINILMKAMCPTCDREWKEDSYKKAAETNKQLTNVNLQLKMLYTELDQKDKKIELLPKIQERIDKNQESINIVDQEFVSKQNEFNKELNTIESKITNQSTELENKYLVEFNTYSKQCEEIKNKPLETLNKIKLIITKLTTDIQTAKHVKDLYNQSVITYNEQKARHEHAIDSNQSKLKETEIELKQLQIDEAIALEASQLCKSYTMSRFKEALDYIGIEATKKMALIPNMENASLKFELFKQNKSNKKVKEEITPVLSVGSKINVPVKSISGGERTSTDLAADLSVIDFIEKHIGTGLDLYIIDEGFNGLESVNKEQVLEILTQYSSNKRIVLIDHNPETKQHVTDVITVERTGDISEIIL